MVGLPNVLLALAPLVGLATGLLQDVLKKGENGMPGFDQAVANVGPTILGQLFGGDPAVAGLGVPGDGAGGGLRGKLASALGTAAVKAITEKVRKSNEGPSGRVGTPPTNAGAGSRGPSVAKDSSEEAETPQSKRTGSGSSDSDSGTGRSAGLEEHQEPRAAGIAFGNGGAEVSRELGGAAGAAAASGILNLLLAAFKRVEERRRQRRLRLKGPKKEDAITSRREKRSLLDELNFVETKGAHHNFNQVADHVKMVHCGRHEIPNPGGVKDRFCHPEATWGTLLRMRPDCVCQEGFLRNSWGECISRAECSHCSDKHHLNMDYHLCESPCPIVCNQPIDENCPNTCFKECACRPGYIREYLNGPCVSIKKCLPGCRGRNQIFSLCSSLCPPTCRKLVPKRCPKICAGEGCVCKPGYVVKKWEPLVCVRPDRCPGRRRKCPGPNQRYTRCKRRCAPSCFRRRNRYCGNECLGRGCVCKPGFAVLQWRPLVCVPRDQCPARRKKCPARNQIYKYCKSKCPPTCTEPKRRKCGSACGGEGCACKPGFMMKQENPLVCVRRYQCASQHKGQTGHKGSRADQPLPWSSLPNEY